MKLKYSYNLLKINDFLEVSALGDPGSAKVGKTASENGRLKAPSAKAKNVLTNPFEMLVEETSTTTRLQRSSKPSLETLKESYVHVHGRQTPKFPANAEEPYNEEPHKNGEIETRNEMNEEMNEEISDETYEGINTEIDMDMNNETNDETNDSTNNEPKNNDNDYTSQDNDESLKAEELNNKTSEPQSSNEKVDLSLEASKALCDQVKNYNPELANALENFHKEIIQRLNTLEARIEKTSKNLPAKPTFASVTAQAPIKFTTAIRTTIMESTDRQARQKALVAQWESRPGYNGAKRLCEDNEQPQEPETFSIVHLYGIELKRDEHRSLPSAILSEKYGLPSDSILNVSSIAYKLQEIHLPTSKLAALQTAVQNSNGALKLSLKLDARLPGDDTSTHEESISRFNSRVDREITRLSKSPSKKLRALADFLVEYKATGAKTSTPRPRRRTIYASAFLDENFMNIDSISDSNSAVQAQL